MIYISLLIIPKLYTFFFGMSQNKKLKLPPLGVGGHEIYNTY